MSEIQPGTPAQATPQTTPPGWYRDRSSGLQRWWNGAAWTNDIQAPVARVTNGVATASLVLGICGFVLMGIPFFIGWVLGGIPDILAVIFGIIGISKSGRLGGVGLAPAIVGLVLGSLSLLSVFIGAGSIW